MVISEDTLEFKGDRDKDWYKGTFTLDEEAEPAELDGVIQDLQTRLDALRADLSRMRLDTERRIDDLSRPAPPDDEPPSPPWSPT